MKNEHILEEAIRIENVAPMAAIRCLDHGGKAWDFGGYDLRFIAGFLEYYEGPGWSRASNEEHFRNRYTIEPKLPDTNDDYEFCERKDAEEQCLYLLDDGYWNEWWQAHRIDTGSIYIYRRKKHIKDSK